MRLIYMLSLVVVVLTGTMSSVSAKIKVVTSTADLAWFAGEIGGDRISVEAIALPTADVHFVEVRPSYMVKVARADLLLKVGLELDMWIDRIIDGSRNSSLTLVDCSKYIEPLEVPTFKADARHGDLHRFGNPHYWLGPDNVPAIVRAILEGLETVDPDNAEYYRGRAELFLSTLKTDLAALQALAAPLKGRNIVFYHNSWPYFNRYFELEAVGFVEPFPGVPPSPSHIKDLTQLVIERNIPVIALEPYFDRRVPEKIASGASASVITLYPSIGGRKKGETYAQWLRGNITALLEALK